MWYRSISHDAPYQFLRITYHFKQNAKISHISLNKEKKIDRAYYLLCYAMVKNMETAYGAYDDDAFFLSGPRYKKVHFLSLSDGSRASDFTTL